MYTHFVLKIDQGKQLAIWWLKHADARG